MALESKIGELTEQSAIVEREKVEWNSSIEQLQTQIKKLKKENENLKTQISKPEDRSKLQNEKKSNKEDLIQSIKNDCSKLKLILPKDANIYGKLSKM